MNALDRIDSIDDIKLELPKSIVYEDRTIPISEKVETKLRNAYGMELEKQIEEYRLALKSYTNTIISDYNEKNKKMSILLNSAIIPPDINFIKEYQIIYGRYNNNTRFIMPFHYAPITMDGKPIINAKRLVREILIAFDVSCGSVPSILKISLLNMDMSPFWHYHHFMKNGEEWDCYGTFEYNNKVTDIKDLIVIRDGIQNLFSNINNDGDDNRIQQNPGDLPSIDTVETTKEVIVWNTKKIPSDITNNEIKTNNPINITPRDNGIWEIRNNNLYTEITPTVYTPIRDPRPTRVVHHMYQFDCSFILPILTTAIVIALVVSMIISTKRIHDSNSVNSIVTPTPVMQDAPVITPINPIDVLDNNQSNYGESK